MVAVCVEAEVVGFEDGALFLMPSGDTGGLAPGARVMAHEPIVQCPRLGLAPAPIRGAAPPTASGTCRSAMPCSGGSSMPTADRSTGLGALADATPPIAARPINAMDREPIRAPLDTGVRAINALLTVGRGQRLGLFAGAGVGKSVLMGMMARYTRADVIVVGLIGERGREIKEFIDDILGTEGRALGRRRGAQ